MASTSNLNSDEETAPLLAVGERQSNAISPEEVSRIKRNLIVLSIFIGAFLASLDLTIVATCIPTISSSLNLSNQGSWIGTAYLWSTVTFTPLYGRLCDVLGRRNAYLQASFLFTAGTFLCGVAPNLPTLAAARFLAGMGGGGMGTVGSVIIGDIVAPRERGLYQSVFFVGFATGMGTGGPAGGWIVEHFDWHAAFYLQLPIVAICIILAAVCLPPSRAKPTGFKAFIRKVDVLGSSSLLISIGALLVALSLRANSNAALSDPRLISSLVTFGLFFLAFIYIETRIALFPVLPLDMLTRRTHLCIGIIAMVAAIVNFSMIYFLPTLFEVVYGASVSQAGSHLLPNSLAMIFGAPAVGWYVRKTGRYKWITVLCSLGPLSSMLWLAFIRQDAKISQWFCVIPMGLGFSGLLTATLVGIMNESTQAEMAVASGFVFTFRSLGQVFGVALSSAIFQATLTTQLQERFEDGDLVDRLRHSTEYITKLPLATQEIARAAFRIAIRHAFLFSASGALIVVITALMIKDKKIPAEEQD